MTSRRPVLALLTGLALGGFGSCGGDEADPREAAAREAVESYLRALTNSDGPAACDRITAKAVRDDLILLSVALDPSSPTRPARSRREVCERETRRVGEAMTARLKRSIRGLKLGAVRLQGTRACVEANRYGFPVEQRMGEWAIAGLRPLVAFEPFRSQLALPEKKYTGC